MASAPPTQRDFRFYVETSVWVRLLDRSDPRRRRTTYRVMNSLGRAGRFHTSKLALMEVADTPDWEMRHQIERRVKRMRPRIVPATAEVRKVAADLLEAGCLTGTHLADLYHLGYAIVGRSDVLLTWNMADLARERTRVFVAGVCRRRGQSPVEIYTPEEAAKWFGSTIK